MITAELATWKTHLSVSIRAGQSARLQHHLDRLLSEEVARLDRLASRFRADSALSAVNAKPGQWVEVSWGFVAVLSACLDAAELTGGLVDPTLGRSITAAGYDTWAAQNSHTPAAIQTGQWRGVGIRPGKGQASVRIPQGTSLDLGSIAKAWLADRLARTLARGGYEVCANMGGDIRVIASDPWTVWADSESHHVKDHSVHLTDGGVATSGTGHRSWSGGHHIIDPRTGRSADTPWRSVCVVAATAAEANAAATAGVILGADGPAWLSQRHLDARFINSSTETVTGRWPLEVAA